jgi:hypothetical protein
MIWDGCMSNVAMCLQLLQTIAVFSVALVGARIAWQQKEIAAEKLKLEKFDRRFRVFDAARSFLGHILTSGDVDPSKEREFGIAILDARFLFDPEIDAYLESLRKRSIQFKSLIWQLQSATDENRGVIADKIARAHEDFSAELKALPDWFAPYLALSRH